MGSHELLDVDEIVAEAEPTGGVRPLTPAQARSRQKKLDKASANLRDTQASNAIKLRKAQRRVSEV